VAGLGTVAAAWFVAASLPPDRRRPATPLRPRALLSAYAPLLRHPPSLRLFGVAGLRAAWWLGLLTYLGAFLGEAVGASTREIGFVYTLSGAGYAAGSFAAGGRLGSHPPRPAVAVANVVAGLLVGPLLLFTTAWVALPLLVVISVASAVCGVGLPALLAAESPAGAGTTMVLNGSLINVGGAAGAALGGALIALGGYDALGFGLPLFAFAAAVLAWWPANRTGRHRRPTP
jgi:predicted MFS family arabinose efflux permease